MREPRPNIPWSQRRVDEREAYSEFMASPEWFARRERWVEEWNEKMGQAPICVVCGRLWLLTRDDLHHVTYERLGSELFEDLMSLCRKDHTTLHEILESNPLWFRAGRATATQSIVVRMRAEVLAE